MLDCCHPIIYVRGYAMRQSEIEEATADPFNGFNVGSMTYRALVPDGGVKRTKKFVFESPVVRLASDFGYRDAFLDGMDLMDGNWTRKIRRRSIIIHRYYDEASELLGTGKLLPIADFAKRLSELIDRVRQFTVYDAPDGTPAGELKPIDRKDFKCYLVAHSMGGLICRAMLQNRAHDPKNAVESVDKFFTYATPHNGIEMAGMNVPSFVGLWDIDNFNRKNIAKLLGLPAKLPDASRVDWMPDDRFDARKVFCMVGTNRGDYDVARGLSRMFAGEGSDGLVKIANASVWGVNASGDLTQSAAVGYCYRSHSGLYGIVNSEESYQNLIRFLFGDLRVDVRLDIESVRLPADLERERSGGKKIDALYQFETVVGPKGKPWCLTRRMADEDSVACRTHAELTGRDAAKKSVYLCSAFLANRAKVDSSDRSLSYRVGLGMRVPDYEVERKLWFDKHYEGGYLFNDAVIVKVTPPANKSGQFTIAWDWESKVVLEPTQVITPKPISATMSELVIPFNSKIDDKTERTPGIKGNLVLTISTWNVDYETPGPDAV